MRGDGTGGGDHEQREVMGGDGRGETTMRWRAGRRRLNRCRGVARWWGANRLAALVGWWSPDGSRRGVGGSWAGSPASTAPPRYGGGAGHGGGGLGSRACHGAGSIRRARQRDPPLVNHPVTADLSQSALATASISPSSGPVQYCTGLLGGALRLPTGGVQACTPRCEWGLVKVALVRLVSLSCISIVFI